MAELVGTPMFGGGGRAVNRGLSVQSPFGSLTLLCSLASMSRPLAQGSAQEASWHAGFV